MAVQGESAEAVTPRSLGAKGVFAAALGNGLEFFDFTVYVTYLGMIGQAFFPSDSAFSSDLASAATFGAGFVARPLGGLMSGQPKEPMWPRVAPKTRLTATIAYSEAGTKRDI